MSSWASPASSPMHWITLGLQLIFYDDYYGHDHDYGDDDERQLRDDVRLPYHVRRFKTKVSSKNSNKLLNCSHDHFCIITFREIYHLSISKLLQTKQQQQQQQRMYTMFSRNKNLR